MRLTTLLFALAIVACSDKPGPGSKDGGTTSMDGGLQDTNVGSDADRDRDIGLNGGTPGQPWEHVSPWLRSPPSSLFDAMAYHGAIGQVVLVSESTWLWDGNRWTSMDAPEGSREGHAVAYDTAREQIVLFGGRDGTAVEYDDTWLFDGTTWTQANPATVPPARYFHGIAYDAARERVVMHGGGGYDGDPIRGDTWEWDGTDWTEVTPTNTPGNRSALAMTYDAARERVVLYGGTRGGAFLDDLWEWDGTEWTDVTPDDVNPPDRILSQLVYDPTREASLLVAGERANNLFGDVWAWDGTAWTDLTDQAGELSGRFGHAAAYDQAAQRLMLFGGTGPDGDPGTLTFSDTLALSDGEQWRDVSPNTATVTGVAGAAAAWDPARGEVVSFGGFTERGSATNETWVWKDMNWRNATPDMSPESRWFARMVADEARGNLVMFGGRFGSQQLDDTWLWDGDAWTEAMPATRPEGRDRHYMGYDRSRERVVMFGGATPGGSKQTWEWDGSDWELVDDGSGAMGAQFFASVGLFEATDGGLLVVGWRQQLDGTDESYEMWHWDGSGWTLRTSLESGPSNRQQAAAAFDGVRDSIILFGGTAAGSLGDTWELADGIWREVTPAVSPPEAAGASMVWQPDRLKILFFGDNDQTWEWNGAVALPMVD